MFPPKKKPAFNVSGKSDLGAPGPLDAPKKKPMPGPPAEEEAESPEYEGQEDLGASMISDMMAPLLEAGMDEATAKSTLAKAFSAASKCLGGGEEAEPAEEVNESDTEDYPA